MATIINMGAGSITQVLLASLTDVPTSSTAISGTESWKKYDAIYFECVMNYTSTSDTSVFTKLILTNNVLLGYRYQPIRVSGSDDKANEVNIQCYFSENVLSIRKSGKGYGVTKLNIYGVNF